MIQNCCYCQAIYGEKEPLNDTSETHGIYPICLPNVLRDLERDVEKLNNPYNSHNGNTNTKLETETPRQDAPDKAG